MKTLTRRKEVCVDLLMQTSSQAGFFAQLSKRHEVVLNALWEGTK